MPLSNGGNLSKSDGFDEERGSVKARSVICSRLGDMTFPNQRPRRLRTTAAIRDLFSEVSLNASDFVVPFFVREGLSEKREIRSLPGIFQHSVDSLKKEVEEEMALGVKAVILFGIPHQKDELGSQAWAEDGIAQLAISELKASFGDDLVVFADLCLDEYTSHGHCGVVNGGRVENDPTLDLYGRVAVAQADAGVDFVAPSGMMDGQVGKIRSALDHSGKSNVGILAYSVKYASSLYGPFRDAVEVEIEGGGDRKGYQQDYRRSKEAILEAVLDEAEGADALMVKPALTYLDIISLVKARTSLPVAAYQVSGEYAMVKAADQAGYIDGLSVAVEQLVAIKRAGADLILSYFAKEVLAHLN